MTFLSKTIKPLLLTGALLLSALLVAQPEIPTLSGDRLVYDLANMLGDTEERALNQSLVSYDDTTSTQIAVVTIETLDGYEVSDYAIRLGEKNGIGRAGKDNGALVLVAEAERKISIQVGYGLEPVITDGLAGEIIRNYMEPAFKKQDYFGGLSAATSVMMKLASGEFTADDVKSDDDGFNPVALFPLLIIFFILFGFFRRRGRYAEDFTGRGYHRTGPIWWGGGFGGGGGGSFGGGGGFGGFGGGSFGGGGASGGW